MAQPKPGQQGYLRWWWTEGPGLELWANEREPEKALQRELEKHFPASVAKQLAAYWIADG